MDITFFYRPDVQACLKIRPVLEALAIEYGLRVSEVEPDAGSNIKVPAFEAAGGRLGVLHSSRGALDERTLRAYLELAIASSGTAHDKASAISHSSRVLPGKQATDKPKSKVKTYMWRHRVGLIIGALTAFLGLAWAAPLFDALGMRGAYSVIFSAYRLVCVQTPYRSPIVGGHQCCLCWRCIAIYAGSLLFGMLYTLERDGRLPVVRWLTTSVGLKGLIIFSLPMFVDGLSHSFGLRAGPAYAHSPDFWLGWGEWQVDWLVRMITALIATVGAVKFLCPRLDKIAEGYTHLPTAGIHTGKVSHSPGPVSSI